MRVTEKCDVFSFGVVTLEVMMGRHPVDLISSLPWSKSLSSSSSSPSSSSINQHTLLKDLLDRRVPYPGNRVAGEVLQAVKLAFACLDSNPKIRPAMQQVSSWLATQPPPLGMPFSAIKLEQVYLSQGYDEGHKSQSTVS